MRSRPAQLVTVEESTAPSERKRKLADFIFGRRLASTEEEEQRIGLLTGIPVLGLDALSSAAYGPEAALTLLLPLGALGLAHVVPITAIVIAVLLTVYFSYRQTIGAYPNGGGSYTVVKRNLGQPGRGERVAADARIRERMHSDDGGRSGEQFGRIAARGPA
jgi:hypothetical protein